MKVNQVKCWFLRRGETGVPGENLSVQSREPTNTFEIVSSYPVHENILNGLLFPKHHSQWHGHNPSSCCRSIHSTSQQVFSFAVVQTASLDFACVSSLSLFCCSYLWNWAVRLEFVPHLSVGQSSEIVFQPQRFKGLKSTAHDKFVKLITAHFISFNRNTCNVLQLWMVTGWQSSDPCFTLLRNPQRPDWYIVLV